MTDLHTHILPGIDDGAQNTDQSVEMLLAQARQGVETVALTPHFYLREESPESFLRRREAAWQALQRKLDTLPEDQRQSIPRMVMGAEVAYGPGMWEWPCLEQLCYAQTNMLLLELPLMPWGEETFRQLYNFMSRTGITPVIAHAERYLQIQKRGQMLQLLEMQLPMQISAGALLRLTGSKRAYYLLEDCNGALISDCHDTGSRAPNLEAGLRWIRKKKGAAVADMFAERTDTLIDL